MTETPDERAARLGAFLDVPPRENHDARLSVETRYTNLGSVMMRSGGSLGILLCKSCCVLVPDQEAYKAVHEQRMHSG